MNYTKIKEMTEYEPQNVFLFDENRNITDSFKAVFKILSATDFEDLLKKVRDEDNGPDAIEQIVNDNLIRYEGITGVPEEIDDQTLMADMNKDGRKVAATWGCLRDFMLRQYDQSKKKSKGSR